MHGLSTFIEEREEEVVKEYCEPRLEGYNKSEIDILLKQEKDILGKYWNPI